MTKRIKMGWMKLTAATLALLLTMAASICAQQTQPDQPKHSQKPPQSQQGPADKLHHDYPDVQMLIPTNPPWHYNFYTKKWEQDKGAEVAELPDEPPDLFAPLRKMMVPAHKTGRSRRRKNRHHHGSRHRRK